MKGIGKIVFTALTVALICLLVSCGEQAPSGDTMETKAQTFTDDTDGFETVGDGVATDTEKDEESSPDQTEDPSSEDAVELPKIPI